MMDIIGIGFEIEDLRTRFLSTQERTDQLTLSLSSEDAILSVTEETSPPKWHLGHTTWFFAKFILWDVTGICF